MANTFTPVIVSVTLTPNPAEAGKPVRVSIAAADVEAVPTVAVYQSGEFQSGEV